MADLEDIKLEIDSLRDRVAKLEARNLKVEGEKKWETSFQRRFLILLLTYFSVSLTFFIIEVDKPLLNAIVPTVAFFISTLGFNRWKIK